MLTLEATQTIQGSAGTATAITYSVMGDEITVASGADTFKVLAQGQLAVSAGILGAAVPAGKAWIVRSISLANATGSSVSSVKVFVGGTAATNQIVNLVIPANGEGVLGPSGWRVNDANGSLLTSGIISLTGDLSGSGASPVATTLATVNANVGSFGSNVRIPTYTVNAKGLTTASSDAPVLTTPSGQTPVGATRSIGTTAPLTGGGDLSADRTLAISAATASTAGSQSAVDKAKEDNMWYDVVADGGADRTGSVDATAIVQAAINAVAAAGGGIVFIPRGTYKITTTITITGNFVTVRGASRVASKLVPNFATGNIFTISGIFNRFEYLRIEPASSALRTSGYAFEFTSTASNCGCQWVDILFMWSGVRATGQLCRLEDMNIRECGYNASNGQMVLIDSFTDQYCNKLVMDNNPVSVQSGFAGVRITNLSSLIMTDCQVIHCQIGMDVAPTTTNSIPSIYCANTFFDNGTIGANFVSAAGTINRCRFIQCWFSSSSVAGVFMNCALLNGVDFVSCDFYGNPVGIDAVLAVDWAVRASRMAGNTTAAIRTTAAANHSFTISDNNIGNTGGFGANALGINIQAGTYSRYQVVDNRGLDTNTTPGITDAGTSTQKVVGGNLGALLTGAIASLGATVAVPVTTETLVLSARIPANAVIIGTVFRVKAVAILAGANVCTWRTRVGAVGTVAGDTVVADIVVTAAGFLNGRSTYEGLLTVRSIGTPGSCEAEGHAVTSTAANAAAAAQTTAAAAATSAITTTAAWFIDISLAQTIAGSTIVQGVIEVV